MDRLGKSILATMGIFAALQILIFAAFAVTPAIGADFSDWDRDARAGVRLVAGNALPDGTQRAGVEVVLAPGWKTYWRYPGDSGVPPRFDFARSAGSLTVPAIFSSLPLLDSHRC